MLEDADQPERIIGYYTLTMTPIDLGALPPKLQKKHHNARAGGLIARLAVDKHYARQGYGEFLLVDALQNLLLASEIVGFPLVVVDAKDGAVQFYARFGFTAFNDAPNKLFITVANVRSSLASN